ncbi:MAG: 30S ribosome-binding factor RbfA [Chthoniobacteraceae bacterium]
MKHRLVRVRELLKRELGDLISREFHFTQLVTVQDVDITPDLKQAHVYVSVLGDNPQAVMAKLHEHRKELQSAVSKRVILKYTPQLHFNLDEGIERSARIFEILQTLDIPETPEEPGDPEDEHKD